MPLYEVAILEIPTKKQREDGAGEKLVFGPTTVIAKDDPGAIVAAMQKANGKDRLKDVNQTMMQVITRPFADAG